MNPGLSQAPVIENPAAGRSVTLMRPQTALLVGLCTGAALGCHDHVLQPTGAATRVAFTVQPSNTSSGRVISPPVQVAALDAQGNTVANFAGKVSVAIGTNPPGGTLSGATIVAASSGLATFSDLSIDLAGNGYRLTASATIVDSVTGLSVATSTAFNVACINACWTGKAAMPTAREIPGVAAINGIIYAIGGNAYCGCPTVSAATGVVEAYDPITDTWTTKAPMPTPRAGLAIAAVNGVLYAVGGYSAFPTDLAVVEAYDPMTDTWTTMAPMPTARSLLGVAVANGVLYAIGGVIQAAGYQGSNVVEAYDAGTNTWTTKAPMPTARFGLGVGVASSVILAIGGGSPGPLATVEAYDPLTNTWSSAAYMPTARSELGVGVLSGILYAVGGAGTDGRFTGTVEAFDATTGTWTSKPSMPGARSGLGVGVLNGVLYAIGGGVLGKILFYTGANYAYQP